MTHDAPERELSDWLARARNGDETARQELLAHFRDRLRRMISLRLDPRLQPRLDASDVVQEALADAWGKLPEFFSQPLPFYPWLRQLAWITCSACIGGTSKLRSAVSSAKRSLP